MFSNYEFYQIILGPKLIENIKMIIINLKI